MVLGLCKGFVGKQLDEIEKGIRLGIKEYYRGEGGKGKVPPEVLSKIMTSLYMGLVFGSIAEDEIDVEEGERMIDGMVDFFLK